MHRILRQRNPDRIPDPVRQQRPDPDRRLDPPILPIARFGHPEMNRIIPIRPLHLQARHQQAIRLDHHLRIRGLHRKNDLVVVMLPPDPRKLQRALHHPQRRVAVAVHDAVRQRSMIRPDPHGPPQFLAAIHQRHKLRADPLQLLLVIRIAVLPHLELLLVHEVPRIHPHLLHPLRRLHRRIRLEVNVRHQRHLAARPPHPIADVLQVLRILHRLRRDPHDFAPRLRQQQHLLHTGLRVPRVRGDH